MNNFNVRLKERWQKKRSKASNWMSLVFKILILIVILYIVQKLARSGNLGWNKTSNKADTVLAVPTR